MFKKVLVAEDFDSINIALVQSLQAIDIATVEYAKYCDDALLKFKKAIADGNPYELLITDLSFVQDHRMVALQSGSDLIVALRAIDSNIKVIVYSVEDRPHTIQTLFDEKKINGYVHKGRNSIAQLKTAIETVYNNKNYISPELRNMLLGSETKEIDQYDIQLLSKLATGTPLDEMESVFKNLNIKPNSKSSIEKRVARLKDYFKASNNIHLIAIAKDLGII